jgi:mannose-6-phosphate isomerase-like protein (cupin superfamily)
VLDGALTIRSEAREDEQLQSGDAVVVPADTSYSIAGCSSDLELLEVARPATGT